MRKRNVLNCFNSIVYMPFILIYTLFFFSCCCSQFSPHKDCSCWVYTFDNMYFDPCLNYTQKQWKAVPSNGLRQTFSVVLLYHRFGTFNRVLSSSMPWMCCWCMCAYMCLWFYSCKIDHKWSFSSEYPLRFFFHHQLILFCAVYFSSFSHSRFQLN